MLYSISFFITARLGLLQAKWMGVMFPCEKHFLVRLAVWYFSVRVDLVSTSRWSWFQPKLSWAF